MSTYLSPVGFTPTQLEEVEQLHEVTKLHPFHDRVYGQRIHDYLTSERAALETAANYKSYSELEAIDLPHPADETMNFQDLLSRRHSTRQFAAQDLTLSQLSGILHSCFASRRAVSSIGEAELKFRPYPSGGGLCPSEVYVVAQRVEGAPLCVTHYNSLEHKLEVIANAPFEHTIEEALNDRENVLGTVSAIFLITSLLERTVVKYGYRGYRFALMEAGMIPLILDLSATAQGLGTLHWGGYYDELVNDLLGIDGVSETATACLLVGHRQSSLPAA
ncbi:MAG: SagB/ThcOx family dehydrogenase [Gammaproteobacteria bacterium]|nr:SagB/ThcOx family dehydrogenase [Gammaproteobacteria bacterium]MDE0367498.1 SagB/ThcOx family dehydrogenase [Gammaproteobacteria bacterium]